MNKQKIIGSGGIVLTLVGLAVVTVLLGLASRVLSQEETPEMSVPATAGDAAALGSSFNYSGQLDNGTANGQYDFRFELYDSVSGGTQIGASLEHNDVQVTRGLFSISLDFGAVFNNNPRFLEIGLRPGNQTGDYTVLTPRRPISPTPLALYSHSTNGLRINSRDEVLIGVNPAEKHYAAFARGQIWTSHPTADAQVILGFGENSARIRVGGPSATGAPFNQIFELQGPGDLTYFRSSPDRTRFYGGLSLYPRDESNAALHVSLTENGTQLNLGGTGPYISGLEILRQNNRIARFDTSGVTIDQSLTIRGGADLAERFEVSDSESAEPGTVMVIDPDNPGHLTASTMAYDTKVAGVVSGAGDVETGLVLSQTGVMEGDTVVAIAGRVYVRAEAISGPIVPGDLLTSSDLLGYAMVASDRDRAQGAVIGKAMTGLDSGTGLVLVLVNLQ